MRFKTTIEIVSEAQDKSEAREIVGEYLSGYLTSGVDMKCSTKPVHNYKPVIGVVAVVIMVTVGILSMTGIKATKNFVGIAPGFNAVQAPLKTSTNLDKGDFKKSWEEKQTREALQKITK